MYVIEAELCSELTDSFTRKHKTTIYPCTWVYVDGDRIIIYAYNILKCQSFPRPNGNVRKEQQCVHMYELPQILLLRKKYFIQLCILQHSFVTTTEVAQLTTHPQKQAELVAFPGSKDLTRHTKDLTRHTCPNSHTLHVLP